jgi:hypothetical protein
MRNSKEPKRELQNYNKLEKTLRKSRPNKNKKENYKNLKGKNFKKNKI